jgi:antitoxin YobK
MHASQRPVARQNVERALKIIAGRPDLAHFAGPRANDMIDAASRALGLEFPPSYRSFLDALGAGSFGSFEIFGVVTEDFENRAVPDGIWVTLKHREDGLPNNLIVVGDTGDGADYVLVTRPGQADEAAVAIWYPKGSSAPEIVAPDFGTHLLREVEASLARAPKRRPGSANVPRAQNSPRIVPGAIAPP